MLRKIAGILTACAAAVLVATGTTAPASASIGASVSLPGAFGKVDNVQFTSAHTAHFEFFLEDMAKDGDHAQARVVTLDSGGTMRWWLWHSAIGYHARYSAPNSYATDSRGVQAIRIEVCRMGDSLPDICDFSGWRYNPYE